MNNEQILQIIEQRGISGELISELIVNHSQVASDAKKGYDNYVVENLKIQQRQLPDPNKINEKLNLDFRKLIVNQALGYAFGVPITHEINNNEKYTDDQRKNINNKIKEFLITTQAHKKNLQTAVYSATGGYAGRYFYFDEEINGVNFQVLPAWQCIFLGNKGIDTRYKYGLIYWNDTDINGNDIIKATFLTDNEIYEYVGKDRVFQLINTTKHSFGIMPLVKFKNNLEEKNDFYNVDSLIDAIDILLSDAQNEIEEQRLAYIIMKGDIDITQEVVRNARQTGVFSIPEEADIFYLEKSNNDGNIENQYNRLKENIFTCSQSVDYTDDNFAGSGGSGEARKWKLLPLENKIGMKIVEFKSSLLEQWRLITNIWSLQDGLKVDYFDISNNFTRNLPIDLDYVATYSQKMKGVYSDKTIFANSPIVDNPDEEIERLKEQDEMNIIEQYNNSEFVDNEE